MPAESHWLSLSFICSAAPDYFERVQSFALSSVWLTDLCGSWRGGTGGGCADTFCGGVPFNQTSNLEQRQDCVGNSCDDPSIAAILLLGR